MQTPGHSQNTSRRPTVAVVGPLPPPVHGHMVVTERVLRSGRLAQEFELVHVDLSDHRPLDTIGRFDATNVALAFRHMLGLVHALARRRPRLVYLPLSQNRLGLMRDLVVLTPALLTRRRVVAHVHGGGFGDFLRVSPPWFAIPALTLLRRCAALVVMSEWQRAKLQDLFRGLTVAVVPLGTRALPGTASRPERRSLHVLFVSSVLTEAKGVFVALEAALLAENAGLDLEWTFVGTWTNGQEREHALQRSKSLSNVTFTGAVDREAVTTLYEEADVLVFPTTAIEGFPLARIEAMAAGLPVITTEAGGAREVVRDGVDGFIVDYDNPGQIVERLARVERAPELRSRMGRAAQQRQRALFSEEAFDDALAGVWRAALS